MTWLQTKGGIAFDLLAPEAAAVSITDIAYALSHINRFTGHVGAYSVAEHCIHVSRLVPDRLARAALLHDAHEAYTQDLSRPLKRAMAQCGCDGDPYGDIVQRVNAAIATRYDFDPASFEHACIKGADVRMLEAERRRFFPEMARDWCLPQEDVPEVEWIVLPARISYGGPSPYADACELAFKTRAAELWVR